MSTRPYIFVPISRLRCAAALVTVTLSPAALPTLCIPFLAFFVLSWLQWATGRLTFAGDALVVSFYAAFAVACIGLGYAAGRAGDASRLPTAAAVVLLSYLLPDAPAIARNSPGEIRRSIERKAGTSIGPLR